MAQPRVITLSVVKRVADFDDGTQGKIVGFFDDTDEPTNERVADSIGCVIYHEKSQDYIDVLFTDFDWPTFH